MQFVFEDHKSFERSEVGGPGCRSRVLCLVAVETARMKRVMFMSMVSDATLKAQRGHFQKKKENIRTKYKIWSRYKFNEHIYTNKTNQS